MVVVLECSGAIVDRHRREVGIAGGTVEVVVMKCTGSVEVIVSLTVLALVLW